MNDEPLGLSTGIAIGIVIQSGDNEVAAQLKASSGLNIEVTPTSITVQGIKGKFSYDDWDAITITNHGRLNEKTNVASS